MPDEEESETEIHVADEEAPALTSYEPNFQRVFARGTLIRKEEKDDNMIQLGFWSSKDTNVELPEEDIPNAVGYHLETEVMMDWDSALRLRDLLDNYIHDHAPDEYLNDD
jgi:hypothetical protein